MPEILDRCVSHVMGKGHSESSAYAICRSSMGLKSDGSEDAHAPMMPDDEMMMRADNAMAHLTESVPILRKRMVVCTPFGKFVNGEQKGVMDAKRLRAIAENFKKYPRQVPVYALGDHVESLGERLPDGWVEGLSVDGDGRLIAEVKLIGSAVDLVREDRIRLASIGTVQGKNPDGSAQGEVLQHVLLTNDAFDKQANIQIAAALTKGVELFASFTTSLPTQEAEMAVKEVKELEEEITRLKDENATLKEEVAKYKPEDGETITGLRERLSAKIREVADLTAKTENLKADVERLKNPASVATLKDTVARQERLLLAMKVRDKVKRGVAKHQFNVKFIGGKPESTYDHESDEGVLDWFNAHPIFRGEMENLDTCLAAMPEDKRLGRSFGSGEAPEADTIIFGAEEKDVIASVGKTPEAITAALKARDLRSYQAAVAAKG